MTKRTVVAGFAIAIGLAFTAPVRADEVWTGVVRQNNGAWEFTVVMRLSDDGGETEYPELKCSGKLTRVAQSGNYSFYLEKITTAGVGCIDGAITLMRTNETLAWGWVGAYQGETLVAWSSLTRK
jgi:hypothetical protein